MFLLPHLLCLLGLLALDTVHTSPLAEVKLQRGNCPNSWLSFNGRCYQYVGTRLTWADAEQNCVSQGANLVSIFSVEEHNFVRRLIQHFDRHQGFTWIGLTDTHKEGWWTWSDGCRVGYTVWFDGMPNGGAGSNCVETNFVAKWNDQTCSSTLPSVCASRTMCP